MRKERNPKLFGILLALLLAVMLPMTALAETVDTPDAGDTQANTEEQNDVASMETAETESADEEQSVPADASEPSSSKTRSSSRTDKGQSIRLGKRISVDTKDMTEEQKTIYDDAVALYYQIEASVLNDLVTAGAVEEADVDTYQAQRDARQTVAEMDTASWTADQLKAYYEANALSGTERTDAFDALVLAGQLTEEQGEACKNIGSTKHSLTLKSGTDTSAAVESAQSTLSQARQALKASLEDAGITFKATSKNDNGSMKHSSSSPNGKSTNQRDATTKQRPNSDKSRPKG